MGRRTLAGTFAVGAVIAATCFLVRIRPVIAGGSAAITLYSARRSPMDIEISGRVAGLKVGSVGYVGWDQLKSLPQIQAVVSDDPDMPGVTMRVSGVKLDEVARAVQADAGADLIDATCTDGYRAYYPADMVAAHRPILVLTIDGMTPKQWAAKTKQEDPGPYLVMYDHFVPAWKVLAHVDRPQLPTNVTRLTFDDPHSVYPGMEPRAGSEEQRQGYEIARQNCIRCHVLGTTGGTKSAKTWGDLGRDAKERPDWFVRVVKDPKSVNAKAEMPGNSEYDAATLGALTHYFSLFEGH